MQINNPCPQSQSPCATIAVKHYLLLVAIIGLSILYFDRSLATYIHENIAKHVVFEALSQIPLALEIIAAIVIISSLFPAYRKRLKRSAIHLMCVLALAAATRLLAKFIFGRTWPDTWIQNPDLSMNPSWIVDNIEAFYPFSIGAAYDSFPSGHALFTYALVGVLWHHQPKYKLIWCIALIGVIVGQLGQNYHYLGDLIAGAVLGTLCAQVIIFYDRH